VKIKTTRFGELEVAQGEIIKFKDGIIGFEQQKSFVVVDPNDQTLILWLQSTTTPNVAFPILEPQIFKNDYCPTLMPTDMKSIQLENTLEARVYAILTITSDITQMSANIKAPIVINQAKQVGRQIVLQDNKLTVKHEMYRELKFSISNFQTSDDQRRTLVTPIKAYNPENDTILIDLEDSTEQDSEV
jgi:flagellar assembly factor FliW